MTPLGVLASPKASVSAWSPRLTLKFAAGAVSGVPVLSQIVSPDRWLLWLGIGFVLSVYYFPTGVVGRLRALTDARRPERSA